MLRFRHRYFVALFLACAYGIFAGAALAQQCPPGCTYVENFVDEASGLPSCDVCMWVVGCRYFNGVGICTCNHSPGGTPVSPPNFDRAWSGNLEANTTANQGQHMCNQREPQTGSGGVRGGRCECNNAGGAGGNITINR